MRKALLISVLGILANSADIIAADATHSASIMKRPTPSWLANAIFYEVYPQTFFDTDGDGIGDLPGVIAKLDYIHSIGCDAIWLNPCFESPFGDAGYDISDFYKVAPRYGTNADLKRLFKEAHRRGMRVCLDLVAGHTSVEHQWFRESAKAKKNKYTNWYVWTDNVWKGAGGDLSTVKGFSERDGSYVTNFFHFQPALNYGFANPDPEKPWQLPVTHPDVKAVRQEMMNIMRFWLDKGADGFRVDMASSLVKGDTDHKATMAFWNEVRATYDRDYPEAVLIAEWSFPSLAIRAGFHVDFMIHFGTPAYTTLFRNERERDVFGDKANYGHSFFDKTGGGDIRQFVDIYLNHYQDTRALGYISLPTGNHDISRISLGRNQKEMELVYAFLLTMPGVPYLYNGDEIGMQYVKGLVSKEGGYGRTGSRTPMQWNSDRNAGFSIAPAEKLYLPVDSAKSRPTVQSEDSDPGSLLNHVRSLIKLRRQYPALGADGEFKPLFAEANRYPFIYQRKLGTETIVIAVNPSGKPVNVTIARPKAESAPVAIDARGATIERGKSTWEFRMEGVSYGIFEI